MRQTNPTGPPANPHRILVVTFTAFTLVDLAAMVWATHWAPHSWRAENPAAVPLLMAGMLVFWLASFIAATAGGWRRYGADTRTDADPTGPPDVDWVAPAVDDVARMIAESRELAKARRTCYMVTDGTPWGYPVIVVDETSEVAAQLPPARRPSPRPRRGGNSAKEAALAAADPDTVVWTTDLKGNQPGIRWTEYTTNQDDPAGARRRPRGGRSR